MQIDPNVSRIKVVDELGKILWRKPDEVKPTDQVMLHPTTGLPITMNNDPGRKPSFSKTPVAINANSPVPALTQAQIAMSAVQQNITNQQVNKVTTLLSDKILGNVMNNIESGDVLNSG